MSLTTYDGIVFDQCGAVINVRSSAYGAVGDGTHDDTEAITRALQVGCGPNGGVVYFPPGEYLTDVITLPLFPKVVQIAGAGMRSTVIVARNRNRGLFQTPQDGPGIVQQVVFRDFSVKAHPNGSTGPAFNLQRSRACTFERIEYLSNGSGNFNDLFYLTSIELGGVGVCLGHKFDTIVCAEQSGPTRSLFKFDIAMGPPIRYETGANIHSIRKCFVYSNRGLSGAIIDGAWGSEVTVAECLFEANAGITCIKPGTSWVITQNHFEANGAAFEAVADTSNSVVLIGNYFSGRQTLDLSGVRDWMVLENAPEFSLAITDPGDRNHHIQFGKTVASQNRRVTLADGPTVSLDAARGSMYTLSARGSRTIVAPANPRDGQEFDLVLHNDTTGAIRTTWNKAFKLAGGTWTDPAATKRRSIRFRYDGSLNAWVEIARAGGDI